MTLTKRLFAAWDDYRAGGDREQLAARIAPSKRSCERCSKRRRARAPATAVTATSPRTCSSSGRPCGPLRVYPAWSRPTTTPNAGCGEPSSFASSRWAAQSESGERAIERLLSASVTCRLQGRSLFAYLSDVLAANIRGDPVPSLV